MIAKCANPDCSNPFRYLHEGRLFVRSPTSKADSGHRDDSSRVRLVVSELFSNAHAPV